MSEYSVQDLQDNLDYLNDTKTQIKQAIVNKGQTISEGTPFREYAEKISAISTGTDTSDATATANDILAPETAYAKGKKLTGTIACEYETISNGIDCEKITFVGLEERVQSINDEYKIILAGNQGGSYFKIYKYDDEYNCTMLQQIDIASFASADISQIRTEDGYLTIAWRGMLSGTAGMMIYMAVYDPQAYKFVENTQASVQLTSGKSWFTWGNITINPKDPYSLAVGACANWRFDTFALLYTRSTRTISQYRYYFDENVGAGAGSQVEWGSGGTRMLTIERKWGGRWYIQTYTNGAHSSITHIRHGWTAAGTGPNVQGYSIMCIWTDNYYIDKTNLKTISGNTVVANWSSYYTVDYYTFMWTYQNYLFVANGNSHKVTVFYISNDFTLTKVYEQAIDGDMFQVGVTYGGTQAFPCSNKNLWYINSLNVGYKFTLKGSTKRPTQAIIKGTTLFATDAAEGITTGDVLTGKIYYDKTGQKTGTMANNGTMGVTPSTSTQTLPSGYYSTLKVYGDADLVSENIKNGVNIFGVTGTYQGVDTSDATAVATDIKFGQTAYVNGEKITGTLPEVISPESISSTEIYNGSFFKPDDAVGTGTSYGHYLVTDDQGSHIGTQYLVNWVRVTNLQTWYMQNQQKVKVGMPVSNIATLVGLTPNKLKKGEVVLGVTGTLSTDYIVPEGMKFKASSFTTFPTNINTSNVVNMSEMLTDCRYITTIPLLNTSNATNMGSMFAGCRALTSIPLLNTSNVTNMMGMFNVCPSLTTIPLLNTSKVTNMSSMFSGCTTLTSIPLIDTSIVTNMYGMFNQCENLTDLPQLNTSNVTDMRSMFIRCISLVNLPLLDTAKVTSMQGAFTRCDSFSNQSLNNVLAMCANATAYTATKTLANIGLSSTQATTCTTLSNWSAAQAAGWTTGY